MVHTLLSSVTVALTLLFPCVWFESVPPSDADVALTLLFPCLWFESAPPSDEGVALTLPFPCLWFESAPPSDIGTALTPYLWFEYVFLSSVAAALRLFFSLSLA